jgi:hypothetical protein
MKVIAAKLVIEMEFLAASQAEVDRVVARHASYLGLKSAVDQFPPEMVISENGNTVRVFTKPVDIGSFDD